MLMIRGKTLKMARGYPLTPDTVFVLKYLQTINARVGMGGNRSLLSCHKWKCKL